MQPDLVRISAPDMKAPLGIHGAQDKRLVLAFEVTSSKMKRILSAIGPRPT